MPAVVTLERLAVCRLSPVQDQAVVFRLRGPCARERCGSPLSGGQSLR